MDWKTLVGFTILFHGIVYAIRKSWILRLDTKKFNKCINGISTKRIRKYLRIWFRIGSYVTICVGFPFTLWLFLRTILYALLPSALSVALEVTTSPSLLNPSSSTQEALELHHNENDLSPFPEAEIPIQTSSHGSYLAIQPIFPGWNLPLTQLPYYLLAILISVIVHELGHAVASASHRIPIVSMGVSLFGPLIPAAHVELNTAQLREVPFKKQMDILTAGVWMNMYLSLITYFLVPWILPSILLTTHSVGNGMSVTGVISSSGAGGPGGLERGDVIFGVENCRVDDMDSWLSCLESIWVNEPVGFCLDSQTVLKFFNGSENPGCCGPDQDTSPTHLCFMQMMNAEHINQPLIQTQSNTLPIPEENQNPEHSEENQNPEHPEGNQNPEHPPPPPPPDSSINNTLEYPNIKSQNNSLFCLPAKPVVASNDTLSPKCHSPHYACPNEQPECYVARILKQYNLFRIVQIHRRQSRLKESVLFVGNVWDLRNGVHGSDYVPRDWWLVQILGYSYSCMYPVVIETILLLTAGLSAGLAVVNMLPIYGLDGYHIVEALLRTGCRGWEPKKISRLVNYISWSAVFLALLTILCSIRQNF